MLVVKWWTVQCEFCGRFGPVDQSQTDAIASAWREGWEIDAVVSLCPDCSRYIQDVIDSQYW